MTAAELRAELQALAEAAEGGPWHHGPAAPKITEVCDQCMNRGASVMTEADRRYLGRVLEVLPELLDRLERQDAHRAKVRALVREQAEEPSLWSLVLTIVEAYFQQELRRLHAAVEAEP